MKKPITNHGLTGYDRGCRCDDCLSVGRTYKREYMRAMRLAGPRPDDQHGLRKTYGRGCRCFDCRVANADYERDRRQRQAQQ